MPRNDREYSYQSDDDDEYQLSPAAAQVLDHIREVNPHLDEVITDHARNAVSYQDAAFTNENTTRGYDDHTGSAVEVMNHNCAAYRIFEAMRESLDRDTSQDDRKQAATDLMHLMSAPYRAGLDAIPPEQNLIRDRLSGHLADINNESVRWLTVESEAHSPTGERFCDQTERMHSLSRDLEHASLLDQAPHFDSALLAANPKLWNQVAQGVRPGIFPENGQPNPRATELLEVFAETTPGWSWNYQTGIETQIAAAATEWVLEKINAQDEHQGEYGELERTPANLMRWDLAHAGRQLENSLGGTPRNRERNNENFHAALQKIMDINESLS